MDKDWIDFDGNTDALVDGVHYWVKTKSNEKHRVVFNEGKFELDSHKAKKDNTYAVEFYIPIDEIIKYCE